MGWTGKSRGGLRAISLCAASLAGASAQAEMFYHYTGTLGDMKADVVLEAERMDDGFGGLLTTERDYVPTILERTPYFEDKPFLIAVRDKTDMPPAAIEFRPFQQGARYLFGRWVDLRTREERPIELQLVQRFVDGASLASYQGELIQRPISPSHQISVHAENHTGRSGKQSTYGQVDKITVRSKSGEVIQIIDGLDAVFNGTQTLEQAYINHDNHLDFSIRTKVVDPATGVLKYTKQQFYVYQESQGRYVPQARLNEWAEKGRFSSNLEKPGYLRYENKAGGWGFFRLVDDELVEVKEGQQ